MNENQLSTDARIAAVRSGYEAAKAGLPPPLPRPRDERMQKIDTTGTTKAQLIQRAKDSGLDFSELGWKTLENFIKMVEDFDDRLFFEWFDLKEGDHFLGKPGNSWGHTDEFVELEFIGRGDWAFPGDGQIASFKSEYMLQTFMSQFGGKVVK